MKETILNVGDVHGHAPKGYDYNEDENYILDGVYKTLKYIFKKAKQNNVKKIIFTGDIFTIKDKIPNRIKNMILDLFKKNKDIDMTVIAGNHDGEGKDTSLKILEPYAHIIYEPKQITLDLNGETKNLLLIPFINDENKIKEVLNYYREDDIDLVVTHFGIKGSSVGAIEKFQDGVPKKWFKDYPLVICGHFHKHQKISKKIYIIGSIYQEDWGEAEEDKYIGFWNGEKLIFSTLPNYINRVYLDVDSIKRLPTYAVYNKWYNFLTIRLKNKFNIDETKEIKEHYLNEGFIDVNFISDFEDEQEIEIKKKGHVTTIFKKFIKKTLKDVEDEKVKVYKEVIEEALGK